MDKIDDYDALNKCSDATTAFLGDRHPNDHEADASLPIEGFEQRFTPTEQAERIWRLERVLVKQQDRIERIRGICERIFGSATPSLSAANHMNVHRQLIGELREVLYGSNDEGAPWALTEIERLRGLIEYHNHRAWSDGLREWVINLAGSAPPSGKSS